MKLTILILLIIGSVVSGRKIKTNNVNIWGQQNCKVNLNLPEDGFTDRWFAKSKTRTNCNGRSADVCESQSGCYKGAVYTRECVNKNSNKDDCVAITDLNACISNSNCKISRSTTVTDGCFSRCKGCYFVTSTMNSLYPKITEGSTKYYIAVESYNDNAGKYLIKDCICKGTC